MARLSRRSKHSAAVLLACILAWTSRTFAFGPAAPPQAPEKETSKTSGANDIETSLLLGREAWQFNQWRAETDDIRGGSSTASLKGLTDSSGQAEFVGVLSEVENAFAGVSLESKFVSMKLEEMKGFVLELGDADGNDYAIALRMLGAPAGVEHIYRFSASPGKTVEMYFRDFKPTLRGQAMDVDQPLVLERVQSISLQARSSFGTPAGDFTLTLSKVLGINGRELPPPPPPARKTKWTCPACGTMNFDTSRYCTRCGESRNAEEERLARAEAEEARKQNLKWECSACGTKNFPSSEECFKCGAPRELRVRRLVRKHEELRAQRLLALNGSFLTSLSAAPVRSGDTFRRRFRLHYSALSHSVQIHLSERFCLTVGGACHVQSSSGAGAAKLMLAATTSVIPGTNVRTAVNVTGTSPDCDFSVSRSLSPQCFVQQKFGMSRDGRYLSLMVSPWLTRTIRGNLTGIFSSDPSLSFSLVKTSLKSGHRARVFCDLQADSGEVGVMFKYKPVKGFSMKLCPTLSRQGLGVQLTCSKASRDALSKLHWALQVRSASLGLRLTLCRCGLRFVVPVELWSEASGPLSATDVAVALAIWAAPPFIISVLRGGWLALHGWVKDMWASKEVPTSTANGSDMQQDAIRQRQVMSSEASKRRREEEAVNGLLILEALYGAEDVTDCLMARVRRSQLQLSNAPKSTLLGFGGHQASLKIRYRFGGATHGGFRSMHDGETTGIKHMNNEKCTNFNQFRATKSYFWYILFYLYLPAFP
eukprot:symbB.v1.2.007435.t1/scaffold454.1/size202171/9